MIDWNSRLKQVREERIREMEAEAEKQKKARKTGEGDHDPAEVLAGTYTHGAYGVVTVFLKEEKLALKFHKFEAGLKHLGGNDFELEGPVVGGLPIRFIKDSEGKINGLSAPLEPKVEDIIFTRK